MPRHGVVRAKATPPGAAGGSPAAKKLHFALILVGMPMFPDQPELKQGAVISEIHQIHTRRI